MSIPNVLTSAASSKKLIVACFAAALSAWMIHRGFTSEQIAMVTTPLWIYLPAQGMADWSKEAKKIKEIL